MRSISGLSVCYLTEQCSGKKCLLLACLAKECCRKQFTMSGDYFKGDEHAAVYNKSRPSPPMSLIDCIVKHIQKEPSVPLGEALDVGCGSGQSTEVLAPYFTKVVGIDPSEKQIKEAHNKNKLKNVFYRIGSAEKIDYPNKSVHLVTASQACHWFDLKRFYSEVERILVPGGALALYGYLLPKPVWQDKTEELSNIVTKYYNESLKNYVPSESKKVYLENYRGEDFTNIPFAKDSVLRYDSFSSEIPGSLADIVNFLKSGSAFQNFLDLEGLVKASKLLQDYEKELMETTGASSTLELTPISIQYKYFLLIAKKPLAF